ncbi:HlyD family efflux transporter periplasmic adaptor subunit [Natranaerobius thermophilus]|uniref:Membrane fusion protein n=1 Tax=Natranaerobius thermophilus (strain ATCC BAA-1301 / DSM 18059 / JW/NM-WN-LF) TaxID=457570 RepID=B2A2I2_NATTJ|nr:HlyD family efflux transporter periplasmic adaptor subunit [Natranaerobius thermophilus]ACB84897.1 hypothetical protein Nther_1314 [Natranaerobius thermophilus JW/NM-WN-LF]
MKRRNKTEKVVKLQRNNKSEQTGTHKKQNLLPVISLLVAVFVLIILISGMRSFFVTRLVNIELVEQQKVDQIIEEQPATIKREEQVITAPVSGQVDRKVDEGIRVKRNQTVMVYDELSNEKDNYQSEGEIKRQIDRLAVEFESELTSAREQDLVKSQIEEIIQDIQNLSDEYHRIVDEKENENSSLREVTSPEPGIVSYNIDGLENGFNDIDKLSPKRLQRYREQHENSTYDQDIVVSRAPLFKVVDNYNWKAIVEISQEETIDNEVGDWLSVKFDFADNEIEGRIVEIKEFDSQTIMVLEFERELEKFWKNRFAEIDIVKDTKIGYKIPQRALTENNGQLGVYLVKHGVVKFEEIELISELENNEVLVDGLNEGNLLIRNSFFVREGDRIR